ncbi:MAG: hypothetical protein AAF741_03465 [Bacteroidota bacterium]
MDNVKCKMWGLGLSVLVAGLLLGCGVAKSAQSKTMVEVWTDPAGQVYEQFSNGELRKYDLPTDTTYIYYDLRLGTIDWVDAANPFSTMVYFEDFQIVVFLDRTLSEVGRLDLRDAASIEQAGTVARGIDDQIWVFDQAAFRLRLIDELGRRILESDDLRRSIAISQPPEAIYARRNWVVAYWPQRGLARFTNTGQFLDWLELPPHDELSWQANGLVGWQNATEEEPVKVWSWAGRELIRELDCAVEVREPIAVFFRDGQCKSY